MILKTPIMLLAASLMFVACSKDKNHSDVARVVQQAQGDEARSLDSSGEKVADYNVKSLKNIDAEDASGTKEVTPEVLAKYPELSRDMTTLSSVDRVEKTDAETLDLYAGDRVVAVLEQKDGNWSVRDSADSFSPTSIEATMSEGTDEMPADMTGITFNFRACMAQPAPVDQDKAQPAPIGQDKTQPAPIEEPEDQDQDQDQDQEQEPQPQPAPEQCQSVRSILSLEKVVEEQQEQEKQQPAPIGQDKEQPAPIDQDKGDGSGAGNDAGDTTQPGTGDTTQPGTGDTTQPGTGTTDPGNGMPAPGVPTNPDTGN